jgi:hypothetical protein
MKAPLYLNGVADDFMELLVDFIPVANNFVVLSAVVSQAAMDRKAKQHTAK